MELLLMTGVILWLQSAAGYVSKSWMVADIVEETQRFYGRDGNATMIASSPYKIFGQFYDEFFISGRGLISLSTDENFENFQCNPGSPKAQVFLPYIHKHFSNEEEDFISSRTSHEEFSFTLTPSWFHTVSDLVSKAFPNNSRQILKMIVVTWRHSSYLGDHRERLMENIFQAIIAADENNTFILYLYNKIEWPKATNSATTGPAEAGIYGGHDNPSASYLIPGSCNYSLTDIAGMTNIDSPGIFVFKVDTALEHPTLNRECVPLREAPAIVTVKPRYVHSLGTVPLILSGIQICSEFDVSDISCIFVDRNGDNSTTRGLEYPGNIAIVCPTPTLLKSRGIYQLQIKIAFSGGDLVETESYIFVGDRQKTKSNCFVNDYFNQSLWMKDYYPEDIREDVDERLLNSLKGPPVLEKVTFLAFTQMEWHTIYSEARETSNKNGTIIEENIIVPRGNLLNSSETRIRLLITSKVLLNNENIIRNEYVYDIETPADFNYTTYQLDCDKFIGEVQYSVETNTTCPVTVQKASRDLSYEKIDEYLDSALSVYMNRFRTNIGLVCVYNLSSSLLQMETNLNMTGLLDQYDVKYFLRITYMLAYIQYLDCCNSKLDCPPISIHREWIGSDYVFPAYFQVVGTTQITNFRFNHLILAESWVFWLLRTSGLAVQISTASLKLSPDVVVVESAVIAFEDTVFEITAVQDGLRLWINHLPVNFYNKANYYFEIIKFEDFTVHGEGFTIEVEGRYSALFVFRNGISLRFSFCSTMQTINILGSIRANFPYQITGLVTVRWEGKLTSPNHISEFRVDEEDSLGSVWSIVGTRKTETVLIHDYLDTVSAAANIPSCSSRYLGASIVCNIDYFLRKNKSSCKCTLRHAVEYEQIQRIGYIPIQDLDLSQFKEPVSSEESSSEEEVIGVLSRGSQSVSYTEVSTSTSGTKSSTTSSQINQKSSSEGTESTTMKSFVSQEKVSSPLTPDKTSSIVMDLLGFLLG